MNSPVREHAEDLHNTSRSSEEENTFIGDDAIYDDRIQGLHLNISDESQQRLESLPSPSQTREQERRLDDDLAVLQAEQVVSNAQNESKDKDRGGMDRTASLTQSRSRRTELVDEFDVATNPVHEMTSVYRPPEHPSTTFSKVVKKIHNSSFLIRYFTYIIPLGALLLIPLLFGTFLFPNANVGGVQLEWFSIWLEIVWLTLWAGRIIAKMIPWPLGLCSSLFTNNSKKWRDMSKQLEIPLTLFFWWLGVEVSFLPTMRNHMVPKYQGNTQWQATVNRIIISILIAVVLNLAEKIIIQLIAISFHLRTYADRIELNKFQIGSLVKLYKYSKEKIAMEDSDFEDHGASGPGSGARTPMQYVEKAQKNFTEAFQAVGDVGAKVAGDFTGRQVKNRTHPNQVVLVLLNNNSGSQVLARRLYRTFIRDGEETVYSEDMRPAFDNDEEADAAFTMFDKDLNGDISMEELEAVCVEIGRERKSITASLKDLDSVVSKLDAILMFIVAVITILVFLTLISTTAAGVLTSLGSTVLALSWLFSATAQEFLQSVIFVFVKHPFDVGDRVTIYGNTGVNMKGDDYFVKEISLLYTEFKKLEGHMVQAPNSYLNTLFILNMRRTGGLAEAVPLVIKFGTTLNQIEELRARLLEFVKAEKREFQSNVLTEVRDITEAYSVSLNVIFFYKSNWQNELLRLQRRNKFICAMMTFMQEIGIEGPLMRLPGQTSVSPFYVQYPSGSGALEGRSLTVDGPGPRSDSLNQVPSTFHQSGDGIRQQHSILRRSGTGASRARGESVSSMAKRVDFSLGMEGVSASDIMGDVYENGPEQRRASDVARASALRLRHRTSTIEEVEDDDRTTGCSSAREEQRGRSLFSQRQPSADSERNGKTASDTHRNRFFGRSGRDVASRDREESLSLMERGMVAIAESGNCQESSRIDPRSGTFDPQAIRMPMENSNVGEGPSELKRVTCTDGGTPERNEEFEMRSLGR